MHFKAFYDKEFKHIGFLPDDDPRELSEKFVRVTEEQWLDLLTETNQIIYDSVSPGDLTKIKIQVIQPVIPEWALEEKIKLEKKKKKDKAMEKLAEMQALTMAATMPKDKLLGIKALFPEWEDLLGADITKINTPYVQYQGKLYLVNQGHTPQGDWLPNATPALYSEVAPPGSIAPWVQPLGAHDAYNMPGSGLPKSDPVTHNGKTWTSSINANIWEPGVYGWIEIAA